jgi:nucleotide-binding universal stress UspA family protein
LDGSAHSLFVLADVVSLIGTGNGSIVLAHAIAPRPVIAPPVVASPGDAGYSESDAREYLERVRSEIPSHIANVQVRVSRGDPAAVVLEAAVELNADVVAVATHGRANLGRFLLGSVAQQVIQSARLPVLVRRPGSSDTSVKRTVPELPLF